MTNLADAPVDGGNIDHTVLVAGARELAGSLGIDAEPTPNVPWPIDIGQRSIMADFSGVTSGSVYLSLGEATFEQIVNEPDTGTQVLSGLISSIGLDPSTVQATGFRPADDLPAVHVVARTEAQIVGFGLTLRAADEAVAPQSYEPAPMASTPTTAGSGGVGAPISLLADVDMQVTVELGRTTLPVRELLSLQPGMVVELDRQAGAPIDVLVNGRLIARGEVVVLDEQFGLRVTEIVTQGAR